MALGARYDRIGRGYARHRRSDPRLSARLWAALGDARTVVNVGAGTGSYEDGAGTRSLVAVEPSAVMIDQRAGTHPVVQAEAERLPFADGAFDAAMAILTVHHWGDLALGLSELRRVARRQVVMGIDPDMHNHLWLIADYVPAIAGLMISEPTLEEVVEGMGAHTVEVVPIPADCPDGFLMAYWQRPERYLDPEVQASTSGFARLQPPEFADGLDRLQRDLADGSWQRRYGHLLALDELDVGLRLVIAG